MVSGFHLWLALIGLYLLESSRITTASAIVFRCRLFSKKWSAKPPFGYPGAERWGWIFAPLVPGGDPSIVSQDFLVAYGLEKIAPNAALVASAASAISYDQIKKVTVDESSVRINDAKFVRCQSSAFAKQTKQEIEQLCNLLPSAREQTIVRLVDSSLRSDARQRLNELRKALRAVRMLVAALWVTAFVLLPVALLVAENDLVLLPVAALTWSLAIAVAFVAPRARRRRGFPWESLKYVLYPVAAMRAQEDLAQDWFTGLHPIALCTDLCVDAERSRCARDILLRVRHPAVLSLANDPGVIAVSDWFNNLLARRLERHLSKAAPEVLKDLVPSQLDSNCVSYCPRCRAQYSVLEGICADCAGVPLQPFTPLVVKAPK